MMQLKYFTDYSETLANLKRKIVRQLCVKARGTDYLFGKQALVAMEARLFHGLKATQLGGRSVLL